MMTKTGDIGTHTPTTPTPKACCGGQCKTGNDRPQPQQAPHASTRVAEAVANAAKAR